ncbi:hypothetical protein [Roseiterribacter gracilis]|uniref:Uncharacterized protein n=1 Tax=Roseiterribacter gracilis TaxID=2812848 RepID=A0A8S8X7J0_9PROT|nr:hypothetical protein TMPK1_14600 [Rhodospirillales bacterium TMPK1]
MKPNDDPALAMCSLWQTNCDKLEDAATLASRCEQVLFDMDADDAGRPEAERQHLAAARARDRISDDLDSLARTIFRFEAKTFEGTAAKLAVAIRGDAPSPTDPNPPWPQLRSVLDDLVRLVAASDKITSA